MQIPSCILNNQVEMPTLGLGVYQSGAETCEAVKTALQAGYRLIDTAALYGNEAAVAEGIAASGLSRSEVFITTKIWNTDIRAGKHEAAFRESLKRLKTDYLDLYLIHWPAQPGFVETWKFMEKMYKAGHIRAIGVSNFHPQHLDMLKEAAEVTPAVNQFECHPHLQQELLLAECSRRGIVPEAWSPLGGGHFIGDAGLAQIAQKYQKTTAQLILRWHLQRGTVVIPKSVHKERILANADVFDFTISAEDMEAIAAMNQNRRVGPDPDNFNF